MNQNTKKGRLESRFPGRPVTVCNPFMTRFDSSAWCVTNRMGRDNEQDKGREEREVNEVLREKKG